MPTIENHLSEDKFFILGSEDILAMFHARKSHRLHRFDGAASQGGRPKWRRLAIEQMESRLMLSGTDLDTSTFNLDFLGSDYAIISTSDAPSSGTTLTDSVGRIPDIVVSATPGNLLGASHQVLYFSGAGDFNSNNSLDPTGATIGGLLDAQGIAAGPLSVRASAVNGLWTVTISPPLSTTTPTTTPSLPTTIDAIGNADVRVNIGPVVDDLLTQGVSILDRSIPVDAAGAAVFAHRQLADTTGVTHPRIFLTAPPATDESAVVSAGDVPTEGGMIPVQRIVGELADETIVAAAGGEQLAPSHATMEITGELTRVAVMELIQGEAEPAGPQPTAEHAFLLAIDDAILLPPNVETRRGAEPIASRWATEFLAGQTGVAASLLTAVVAPDRTGRAGGAALTTAPIAVPARSEAFARWGDDAPDEPRAVAGSPPNYRLDATPILLALACERVLAARKIRQQPEPAGQSNRAGRRQGTWHRQGTRRN